MITHQMVVDAAWELLVDEYQDGTSLDTLAKRHKMTRHSLTAALKSRGDFVDGRRNKKKFDLCKRGHDMEVHGKQLFTAQGQKNGRECMECKRMRQRKKDVRRDE